MKSLLLILALILSSLIFSLDVWAASSSPGPLMTYEGVLTDTTGAPITTLTTLKFQVIYNANCVVFAETRTLTPGASGEFSVIVGTGTRTDNTNNTADRIFASSGTVSCEGSSNATVSGWSTRDLRITVNGMDLSPDVVISNVPRSEEHTSELQSH